MQTAVAADSDNDLLADDAYLLPSSLLHPRCFNLRPIAKGVAVAFYSGEILTAEQLDERYPDFEGSEYVMQLGPDRYLDARDPEKSSIARWDRGAGSSRAGSGRVGSICTGSGRFGWDVFCEGWTCPFLSSRSYVIG